MFCFFYIHKKLNIKFWTSLCSVSWTKRKFIPLLLSFLSNSATRPTTLVKFFLSILFFCSTLSVLFFVTVVSPFKSLKARHVNHMNCKYYQICNNFCSWLLSKLNLIIIIIYKDVNQFIWLLV